MGRRRPKRPHRFRISPRRSPAQRLPLFPRQLPHRSTHSHAHVHTRSRIYANSRRYLRLQPQLLLPPSLRLGRRYPQTHQQRSQLRPIPQPPLTPQHRRPHRRQPLLPLSRPRRPRLRVIRQPYPYFDINTDSHVLAYSDAVSNIDADFHTLSNSDSNLHANTHFHSFKQCANGITVPNPEANPGLVGDCLTLLELRDALSGPRSAQLERVRSDE